MTKNSAHTISVTKRTDKSDKISFLRNNGLVPANVYGEEQATDLISFPQIELQRLVAAGSDAALIYLQGEDKKNLPVLIEEIQNHPVTGLPLHVSFKRVNLKEKVTAEVAVEVIGEFDVPGANMVQVKDVLEVEALPADIPENIVLDVSGLSEIGQTLHLKDAVYDRDKVTVVLSEEELEEPLVLVQEVREEVEEEVEDEAGTETEGEGEVDKADKEEEKTTDSE